MRSLVTTLLFLSATALSAQSFQGLGVLPGGGGSEALGVSGDGTVVVGTCYNCPAWEAFRWTEDGGMEGLGSPPDGSGDAALGASGDGTIIVGGSRQSVSDAFRWTELGGMQSIGIPGINSIASGVSGDGTVAVGRRQHIVNQETVYEAFRWTEGGGLQDLGLLPGYDATTANGVSGDGAVVVGTASASASFEAFRWTQGGGMQRLGFLPGHDFSQAFDVSDDGAVVGFSQFSTGAGEAFRWTEGGGIQGLGFLPGDESSTAAAVSGDGTVIIGTSSNASTATPFIWTEEDGMRNLRTVLVDEYGADLSGWERLRPTGISDDGTVIVGVGTSPQATNEAWRADLGSSGLLVNDANRFGRHGPPLPDATVTLNDGSNDVATTTTDTNGRADFSDTGLDLSLLYDIRIERDALRRTYQAVRLSEIADSTLVLPAALVTQLRDELTALDTTHAFVLGYDIEAAQELLANWTTNPLAELPDVHEARDPALARLLVASEGLADVYIATEGLTEQTAGVTVDAIVSLLAFRKLFQELGAAATQTVGTGVSQGTTSSVGGGLALKLILKGAKLAVAVFQSALTSAAKAALPPWAADLFTGAVNQGTNVANKAFASGSWNAVDARREILRQAALAGTKLAGRSVLASGYVLATDTDLSLATTRAGQQEGEGTVIEAFQASQAHAIETVELVEGVTLATQTAASTFKGWNKAADLFLVLGTVPAAQIAASVGGVLKAFDTGGLIGLAVGDYIVLSIVTFEDAPLVAERAFIPTAMPPLAEGPGRMTSTRHGGGDPAFEAYRARLETVLALVEAGNHTTLLTEATMLLGDDDALDDAVEAQMLPLYAAAEAGVRAEDGEAFLNAYAAAEAASAHLAAERSGMYAALAAVVAPVLATSSGTEMFAAVDSVLAIAPRVRTTTEAFESAALVAHAAAEGVEAPALVLATRHGLDDDAGTLGRAAPDQIVTLTARIVNAGTTPAEGVVVRLVADGDTLGGPAPVLHIDDDTQALGTLAPGTIHTLTWNAMTRDTSATGLGSAATYTLVLTATSGRVRDATGSFEVGGQLIVSNEEGPEAFGLLAAYPNPFSQSATQPYEVSTAGHVRLAVYDLLGRRVAVLADGEREPGRYEAVFDGGGMASGLYLVRMTTNDGFAQTRRITLLK